MGGREKWGIMLLDVAENVLHTSKFAFMMDSFLSQQYKIVSDALNLMDLELTALIIL